MRGFCLLPVALLLSVQFAAILCSEEGAPHVDRQDVDMQDEPTYGKRKEGMYKWQRDKPGLRQKAMEAKARRLGVSVEQVEQMEKNSAKVGDDPRVNKKDSLKAQESNLEGNYGQRGKAYTWQRNKDEVRQKATEAKERKASAAAAASAPRAPIVGGEEAAPAESEEGLVSIPYVLLKYDEPRVWYNDPRICADEAKGSCRNAELGLRVKTLELSDLKENKREQLKLEDPGVHAWMTEMNGLGGNIVKMTKVQRYMALPRALLRVGANMIGQEGTKDDRRQTMMTDHGKATMVEHALIRFSDDVEVESGAMSGAADLGDYKVVRKGKVHDRLSVDSKRLGQIEKAEFIKVVEIREFQNGLWRARFEGGSGKTASGWVSFRNGNDARIIKKVEGKTPY